MMGTSSKSYQATNVGHIREMNTSTTAEPPGANITGQLPFTPNLFRWHGAEILFLIAIFIVGTIGNTLVIYVYHIRWRRSNFTLFIEVLAGIDLTNCLLSVPMFFTMAVNEHNPSFDVLCKSTAYIAIMNAVSSGIVLVIVAYDRNRKIHNPLKHEISLGLTKKLCCLAIVVSASVCIPGVFLHGETQSQFRDGEHLFNITSCFFADGALESNLMFVFVGLLGAVFLFILSALTGLYFSIWRALRVHLQRRASLRCHRSSIGLSQNGNYYRSQKTTARLFFIITVAFFASYFPYYIAVAVFLMLKNLTPVAKALSDLAKFSPLLSSAVNPIIYSISSARFRREISTIVKRIGRTNYRKKFFSSQDQPVRMNFKHSNSGSSFGHKMGSNEPIVFAKINSTERQTC